MIELIKIILSNHKTQTPGKGMPLGNLTSQFLANVYLSELDNFVKHKLRAKYYVRYVDDFIILERNKALLSEYKKTISRFLMDELELDLHPAKSRIIPLRKGVTFLGFRIFYYFKLLKKSNLNRVEKRLLIFQEKLAKGQITKERILCSFAGWNGYAMLGNTYKFRMKVREKVSRIFCA